MSETLCKTFDPKITQKILEIGGLKVLTQDTVVVYEGQTPNVAFWINSGAAVFLKNKNPNKQISVKLPLDFKKESLIFKEGPVLLFSDQILQHKNTKVTVVITKGSEILILDKPTLIRFFYQTSNQSSA